MNKHLIWWLYGWCMIIDGLSRVISLGFYRGNLGNNFIFWTVRRDLDKRQFPKVKEN